MDNTVLDINEDEESAELPYFDSVLFFTRMLEVVSDGTVMQVLHVEEKDEGQ
jgi:hypothetical protein